MTSPADPVHLTPISYTGPLPSIRYRAPGAELGYRMLREFYAPYKRIDAGADDSARVPNPHPMDASGSLPLAAVDGAVGQAKRRMAGEQV